MTYFDMEMHNRDYCFTIPYLKEVIIMKVHIFCHPQALLHPPTTTPRDFLGYTCAYEPKLKQKVLSLAKHIFIQIIFLLLLSLYQMKSGKILLGPIDSRPTCTLF